MGGGELEDVLALSSIAVFSFSIGRPRRRGFRLFSDLFSLRAFGTSSRSWLGARAAGVSAFYRPLLSVFATSVRFRLGAGVCSRASADVFATSVPGLPRFSDLFWALLGRPLGSGWAFTPSGLPRLGDLL